MRSMPRRDSNQKHERVYSPRAWVGISCVIRLTIWSPQVLSPLHHEYRVCDFGIGRDIIRLLCRIGVRPGRRVDRISGHSICDKWGVDRQYDVNHLPDVEWTVKGKRIKRLLDKTPEICIHNGVKPQRFCLYIKGLVNVLQVFDRNAYR